MSFDRVGRPSPRAALVAAYVLALVACGAAATSGPPVLSVSGSYQTQVSLVQGQNTCGAVTVQNNVTTVGHTPGSLSLSITHAGNTFQGSIDSGARFATTPSTVSIHGSQYLLVIAGQFSRTGFDATVQVGVTQPTAPTTCSYAVHWIGTKDGSPNVIP